MVFDASVVVAAAFTSNRQSAACLLAVAVGTGDLTMIVSPEIVAEYRRTVVEHAALARSEDPVALVEDLVEAAETVTPEPVKAVRADPTDDVYLGTAIAAGAAFLVTFDRRHLLPLDPFRGIRIVTPGTLLAKLRGR